MLVKVRFGETQKYVKVAETEDGYDDFNTFLQKGFRIVPRGRISTCSEDSTEVMQGQDEEEHLTDSPKPLVHPLYTVLPLTQDKIKKLTHENDCLREEKIMLVKKEQHTANALEELTTHYRQLKTKRNEMEARMEKMEKAFQREKKAWQETDRQHEEEVNSLKMELLDAQTHNQQVEEDVSEVTAQLQAQIYSLKNSLCIKAEDLSALQDKFQMVVRVQKEDSDRNLRESEKIWQKKVRDLERQIQDQKGFANSLVNQTLVLTIEAKNILSRWCENEKKLGNERESLQERMKKKLLENEESWKKRVQALDTHSAMEKMWLKKEGEWRQELKTLEDEVEWLTTENAQRQALESQKERKEWKRMKNEKK